MRLCVFVFASVLLLSCRAVLPAPFPAQTEWIPLNRGLPAHATVLALAATSEALYAGSYDTVGLFTSTDGAQTWHADNRGLAEAPVYALLSASGVMYAGTAAGLYQRARLQEPWTRVESVPFVSVYALAHGANGALYAATDASGIYSLTGAGHVWTRIPGLDRETVLSILALDSQTILAGTSGHGLEVTRDGGRTWENAPEFAGTYISMLAQDPRAGRAIYLRTRGGLYRSHDAGATWEVLGGVDNDVVHALAFDTGRNRIFAGVGGRGVLLSDDDGATWRPGRAPLPAGRAVLSLLDHGATIFAGTVDGLFKSEDGGESWSATGDGMGVPLLHALALETGAGVLFVASEDGLYESRDQGAHWERLAPDLLDAPVLSVALAPEDPQLIYAGTVHQGVFVGQGTSWSAAGGDLGGRASVAGLAISPHNAQTVFARVLYSRIYKSTDGGDQWRTVWDGMPDWTEVETMAIDPQNPPRIFAGANNGLYYSKDDGETWTLRGLEGVTTFAVWIDPRAANHLLAGTTDGLYQSDDGGENWQPLALTHLTVTTLARDTRGRFYAGTKYDGVYMSDEGGKTFARLGTGLDQAGVIAVGLDEARGLVFAATDRGMFKLVTHLTQSLSF